MDNLNDLLQYKNEVINPLGGISSILAIDHNQLEDRIIKSLGRYTGFPFTAVNPASSATIQAGNLYWQNNNLNNTSQFTILVSRRTADGNDMMWVLSKLKLNDGIKIKDFAGRAALFYFVDADLDTDGSGNNYFRLTLIGLSSNPNYVYQQNESQPCMIECVSFGAESRLDYGSIRKIGKGFTVDEDNIFTANSGAMSLHEKGDLFEGVQLDGRKLPYMRYKGAGDVNDFNSFVFDVRFTAFLPGEPGYEAPE